LHDDRRLTEVRLDRFLRDRIGPAVYPRSVPLTLSSWDAPDEPVPAGAVAFPSKVVDSEYGGRTMDITVETDGTRLHARMAAGESGSWARSLQSGENVRAVFVPGDGRMFAPEPTVAGSGV